MARICSSCGINQNSSSFSRNQWAKGNGYSRCMSCVGGGGRQQHQQPTYHTTGYAVHTTLPSVNIPIYHTGYAMAVPAPTDQCKECFREFADQNQLNMHMQVHRPRQVRCPVCGDVRFRSMANAVQHLESGYCRGCKGQDNARQQIYNFAQNRGVTPLLTNGSNPYSNAGPVPDFPYVCSQCNMKYRNLSQLMQHMDQKHGQMRFLLG